MPDRQQLEEQIRELLRTETSGILLSNKLFSPPDGLFCRLGATEEERRALTQTPLFQEALERLAVLREAEVAAFSRAVQEFQAVSPKGEYRLKLENTGRPVSPS